MSDHATKKPLLSDSLNRDELIAAGVCVACRREPALPRIIFGRQCNLLLASGPPATNRARHARAGAARRAAVTLFTSSSESGRWEAGDMRPFRQSSRGLR